MRQLLADHSGRSSASAVCVGGLQPADFVAAHSTGMEDGEHTHRSHRNSYTRVARISKVSPPTDTPFEPMRSASLARSSDALSAARMR